MDLRIRLTVFALALMVCCASTAKVTPVSLEQMVSRSELIVLGTVERIEATSERKEKYPVRKVVVRVETALKGEHTGEVDVYNLPTRIEAPQFAVNDRVILFLARFDGRYWPVQAHVGKIEVQGHRATMIEMIDEEEEQDLSSFMRRVSGKASRLGTTKQRGEVKLFSSVPYRIFKDIVYRLDDSRLLVVASQFNADQLAVVDIISSNCELFRLPSAGELYGACVLPN